MADEERDRLIADFVATTTAIVTAFVIARSRLRPQIRALEQEAARLEREGTLNIYTLGQSVAHFALMQRVVIEMNYAMQTVIRRTTATANRAVTMGISAARMLTASAGGNVAGWVRPSGDALARMAAYMQNPAMRQAFASFGQNAADNLGRVVLQLTARGKNSRAIAGAVARWFDVPRSWAESMARTAQAYSYRGALLASYRANPNVVRGWRWMATLDTRVCMSCLSQHGSFHTLNEDFNSHHRCRCTPVPEVIGITRQMESGPDWFARQSAVVQRDLMGAGRYAAYSAGLWDWNAASTGYHSDIYGQMQRQATLWEMGLRERR